MKALLLLLLGNVAQGAAPGVPAPDPLQLRDVHLPPPPPWWPPAPGWWLVGGWALVAAAVVVWWWVRRRRWRRGIAALFDASVDAAPDAAARVAMMSELLRRASRRQDPAADRLAGEDWLHFLATAARTRALSGDAGRTLLEGAFRSDVSEAECEALRDVARACFVRLMRRPARWWRWRPAA